MTKEEAINVILQNYKDCKNNIIVLSSLCEGIICTECPFNSDSCVLYMSIEIIKRLIKAEESKLKYKLTQFEYDLLEYYKQYDDTPAVNTFRCWTILMHMRKKGYYKDIPEDTKIRDVLDNAEVVD